MSEQWWAVMREGYILSVEPTEKGADFTVTLYPKPQLYDVVPVRIVEDAGPCPWELSQFGDSQPYKNEKDWISFISQYGWRWCPMCGRSLKEE